MKRSRTIETAFGTALLLGPLAWAVFAPGSTVTTACPEPVVRTERVEVSVPAEPELVFVEVDAEASAEPERQALLEKSMARLLKRLRSRKRVNARALRAGLTSILVSLKAV